MARNDIEIKELLASCAKDEIALYVSVKVWAFNSIMDLPPHELDILFGLAYFTHLTVVC